MVCNRSVLAGLVLVQLAWMAVPAAAAVVHQGCWANAADEIRALPFRVAANNYMTPAFCKRLAVNRFVSSFGLEWGRECWLDPADSNLASLTRFGASNNCTMPCTGDVTTRCGGDYTDDIYTITDALPTSIPDTNYTHIGCYRDNQLDRRMTLLWESNSSMTIDLCAYIAHSEEWAYFAVQWSRECWGGQDLNSSSSLGASTDCTMPCPGNVSQTCGGALALNMYEVNDKYWDKAGYESPWAEPKPVPVSQAQLSELSGTVSLLTAANCTGAAASSPACRAQQSGAGAALLSRLSVLVLIMVAALL